MIPTGLTAQQKEATAQWYSNKTSLFGYSGQLYSKLSDSCTTSVETHIKNWKNPKEQIPDLLTNLNK